MGMSGKHMFAIFVSILLAPTVIPVYDLLIDSSRISVGDHPVHAIKQSEQMAFIKSTNNAPARDGNIAIKEEFNLAIEANTTEALQLFILRHPKHPLAVEAKRLLGIAAEQK